MYQFSFEAKKIHVNKTVLELTEGILSLNCQT